MSRALIGCTINEYPTDRQAMREARAILASMIRGAVATVDKGAYRVRLVHLGGGRVRQSGSRLPGNII